MICLLIKHRKHTVWSSSHTHHETSRQLSKYGSFCWLILKDCSFTTLSSALNYLHTLLFHLERPLSFQEATSKVWQNWALSTCTEIFVSLRKQKINHSLKELVFFSLINVSTEFQNPCWEKFLISKFLNLNN